MEAPGVLEEVNLIHAFAEKHGKNPRDIINGWISQYGDAYRFHYQNGVRGEDMEDKLYGPKELQSNYAEMVAEIVLPKK